MEYFINSTEKYHQCELNSLGWELTVCNALEPIDSPCRNILKPPLSFGEHLYHFLRSFIPFDDIRSALEIGGGMGYLMRDFLSSNPKIQTTMIDISPFLLNKQKETLKSFNVTFKLADILDVPLEELSGFDLVIMNENLGDLPTLVAGGVKKNNTGQALAYIMKKLDTLNKKYGFSLGKDKDEHINIGAIETVERLCLSGAQYIYISEHSCEAVVSEGMKPYLQFSSTGFPEMIRLKGHKEYTMKFSYLQKIAEMLNYNVKRGPFADFLPLDFNDKVKAALRLLTPLNDEQEIIRHFIHDLYKYEYLILQKGD